MNIVVKFYSVPRNEPYRYVLASLLNTYPNQLTSRDTTEKSKRKQNRNFFSVLLWHLFFILWQSILICYDVEHVHAFLEDQTTVSFYFSALRLSQFKYCADCSFTWNLLGHLTKKLSTCKNDDHGRNEPFAVEGLIWQSSPKGKFPSVVCIWIGRNFAFLLARAQKAYRYLGSRSF